MGDLDLGVLLKNLTPQHLLLENEEIYTFDSLLMVNIYYYVNNIKVI